MIGRRRTPSAAGTRRAGRRRPRGRGREAARPPPPGVRLLRRRVHDRLRPARAPRGLLDHRTDRCGQVDHLRRHRLRPLRRPARLPRQQPRPQPVRGPRHPTEVTLEFEAEGRHWVLSRSPAQTRPSAGRPPASSTRRQGGAGRAGTAGRALTEARRRRAARRAGRPGQGPVRAGRAHPPGEVRGGAQGQDPGTGRAAGQAVPGGRLPEDDRRPPPARRRTGRGLRDPDAGPRVRGGAHPERGGGLPHRRPGRPRDRRRGRRPAGRPPPSGTEVPPADDELDLARLPEVREELVAVLASVAAARDGADADCAAARARSAEVRTAAERWQRWRTDVAEAQTHAAQRSADAETAASWPGPTRWPPCRVPSPPGAAPPTSSRRPGRRTGPAPGAVDAAWVDGYRRNALEGATSAHLLASRLTAEAEALERADGSSCTLGRSGRELEADERELADGGAALDRADRGACPRPPGRCRRSRPRWPSDAARLAARPAGRPGSSGSARGRRRRGPGRGRAGAWPGWRPASRRADVRLAAAEERAAALRERLEVGPGRTAGQPTWSTANRARPAGPPTIPTRPRRRTTHPGDDELEAAEQAARPVGEERRSSRSRWPRPGAPSTRLPTCADGADVAERLAVARRELEAIDADAGAGLGTGRRAGAPEGGGASTRRPTSTPTVALDGRAGGLAERRARWEADRDAFVAEHGDLVSTAEAARARRVLADAVTTLAANLEVHRGGRRGPAPAARRPRRRHGRVRGRRPGRARALVPSAPTRSRPPAPPWRAGRAPPRGGRPHRRLRGRRRTRGGARPDARPPGRAGGGEAHNALVGRVATLEGRLAVDRRGRRGAGRSGAAAIAARAGGQGGGGHPGRTERTLGSRCNVLRRLNCRSAARTGSRPSR